MDRGRRLRLGSLAIASAMALAHLVPSIAGAAGITNKDAPGYMGSVGCLTTQLCVLGGYNNKGIGVVIAVRDGVPGHVSTIAGSEGVDAISCPSTAGCVALAVTTGGRTTDLLTVNAAGIVVSTAHLTIAKGIELERIVCASLTACELLGLQDLDLPQQIEVGTWAAGRITLVRVSPPARTTDTVMNGLGCAAGTCVAVGYAQDNAATTGITVSITNGVHPRLHTVGKDLFYGVSCISAVRCYAAGFDDTGGVVGTLTNGTLAKSARSTPDLYGMACTGTTCTAVGKGLAPSSSKNASWGAVLIVDGGVVASTTHVPPSSGFEDVSRVGASYAAVGLGQGAFSEVTTG
jgi:hypothetical protein